MFKKGVALVAIICLLITVLPTRAENNLTVIITGKTIDFVNEVIVMNDIVYLPLREFLKSINGRLEWNSQTKQIDCTTKSHKVGIAVGKDYITVNNNKVRIKNKVIKKNNSTMIPASIIGYFGNYDTYYNKSTQIFEVKVRKDIHTYEDIVNAYMPEINIKNYNLSSYNKRIKVLCNNVEDREVYVRLNGEIVKIFGGYDHIESNYVLAPNSQYTLQFELDTKLVEINFRTSEIKKVDNLSDEQVILIPPSKEKGFNYPYYLVMPSDKYKEVNEGTKKHLFVVPANLSDNGFAADSEFVNRIYEELKHYLNGHADKMHMPLMMPVFPRYTYYYFDQNEEEHLALYQHALDTQTVNLDKDFIDRHWSDEDYVKDAEAYGISYNDLIKNIDIEKQFENMIDHAIDYLKDNNTIVEDKIMMFGFSAAGSFTARWSFLYPHRVKAFYSGGTSFPTPLPIPKLGEVILKYPFGTYDYKEITGRDFDLDTYNNISKIFYRGAMDNNDAFKYVDSFCASERDIIANNFGQKVYPDRWQRIAYNFYKSGGNGLFIMDKYKGHSYDKEYFSNKFLLDFYQSNIESEKPQYIYPVGNEYECWSGTDDFTEVEFEELPEYKAEKFILKKYVGPSCGFKNTYILGSIATTGDFHGKFNKRLGSSGLGAIHVISKEKVEFANTVIVLLNEDDLKRVPKHLADMIPEIFNGESEFVLNTKRDGRHIVLIKERTESRLQKKIRSLNSDFLLKADINKIVEDLIKEDGDLTATGDQKLVYIKENPEKGFNYPYVIILPTDTHKDENIGSKRYLIVEPINFGISSNDYSVPLKNVLENYNNLTGTYLGESLHSPRLIPIFPRPYLYSDDTKLYTHALDSTTVFLEDNYKTLKSGKSNGLYPLDELPKLFNLEKQMYSMIEDAKDRLNEYNHNIEEKVFMVGFSASGKFTNRYTSIYPEQIKATFEGAINCIPMIPTNKYKGNELMYPVGTNEHEYLFGRKFNLKEYNKVAKLMFNGLKDLNEPLDYPAPYDQDEKKLIIKLFGYSYYPDRWKNMQKIMKATGGKCAFLSDEEAGHYLTSYGREYVLEYFKLNRDSDKPVYPKVEQDGLILNVIR